MVEGKRRRKSRSSRSGQADDGDRKGAVEVEVGKSQKVENNAIVQELIISLINIITTFHLPSTPPHALNNSLTINTKSITSTALLRPIPRTAHTTIRNRRNRRPRSEDITAITLIPILRAKEVKVLTILRTILQVIQRALIPWRTSQGARSNTVSHAAVPLPVPEVLWVRRTSPLSVMVQRKSP